MIKSGIYSINKQQILDIISEEDLIEKYFGVSSFPKKMNSPLRKDIKPSFGFFFSGNKPLWKDFSTGESGDIFDLLGLYWGISYNKTLSRIFEDIKNIPCYTKSPTYGKNKYHSKITHLGIKVREWTKEDLQYWESYGISLKWLKYAEICPISRVIIEKESRRYFNVDKLAYAYIEHKEGKTSFKIYQPFNDKGYKWITNHTRDVVSLWTKVPRAADRIVVCSSVKDALCLSAGTGIPAIALQGEGYSMSKSAIQSLKARYKEIFIILDNDAPGIKDAEKLASITGFTNIILPDYGAKDISDLYKKINNKERFKDLILSLFNINIKNYNHENN